MCVELSATNGTTAFHSLFWNLGNKGHVEFGFGHCKVFVHKTSFSKLSVGVRKYWIVTSKSNIELNSEKKKAKYKVKYLL